LGHVRVGRGLTGRIRGIVIRQNEPVGATLAHIELLEMRMHALRGEPAEQRVVVRQRREHLSPVDVDEQARTIGSTHVVSLGGGYACWPVATCQTAGELGSEHGGSHDDHKENPAHTGGDLCIRVEPTGLEPVTPCLQSRCATNCAMAPGGGAVSLLRQRIGDLVPGPAYCLVGCDLPPDEQSGGHHCDESNDLSHHQLPSLGRRGPSWTRTSDLSLSRDAL